MDSMEDFRERGEARERRTRVACLLVRRACPLTGKPPLLHRMREGERGGRFVYHLSAL